MDYLSHNISINLRRIRQSKSMSLEQAAEQTGVSKSMLAQIEKGTANPSLGVLGKITSGLRIEFQRLIETPREDFCLVKPEALVPTKEIEGQYRVWTCFPYEDTRLVEIYRIDIAPGGTYWSGGHGERTKEYVFLLHGELSLETAGGTRTTIREGQAFRFSSEEEHTYRNLTHAPISFASFFVVC